MPAQYADPWGDAASVVAVVTTTGVGLAIVLRRPGNVVGWLLILNGFLLAASGVITAWAAYALQNPDSLPGGRTAAILETHTWPLIFAAVVALGFVFPDGRLPSGRWRAAVVLAVASFGAVLVGGTFSGERLDAPFEHIPPSGALPDPVSNILRGLGLLGMIVTFVLAMAALVVRFRRSEGEERAQIKWIAYAGAFIPVSIILGSIEPNEDGPGGSDLPRADAR